LYSRFFLCFAEFNRNNFIDLPVDKFPADFGVRLQPLSARRRPVGAETVFKTTFYKTTFYKTTFYKTTFYKTTFHKIKTTLESYVRKIAKYDST